LNAKHHVPPTLLDFTLGDVIYDPFNVNPTRISRDRIEARTDLGGE